MAPESRLPHDPVRFVQDCVRRGRVLWTYHVNMRLAGRFIPREAILAAVDTYELVEAYPDDKCLPATCSWAGRAPRHSMCCARWISRAIMSALSRRTASTLGSGKAI